MSKMLLSSDYTDLSDFLAKHKYDAKSNNKEHKITHTRIGDPALNVYGGSWYIPKEELQLFWRLYYEYVFVKGRKEYLTERQLEQGGPILVDFDFRYTYETTTRQHEPEHIQDIVSLYLEELKGMLEFEPGQQFPIFIMEKPGVNRVADKQITKDGIHMLIGIQMDHVMQMMLRDRIMKQIGDVIELPLTNEWSDVLDEGISKGVTNWQLFGSQKPGCEPYKVTYYMIAEYDAEENDIVTKAKNPKELDMSKDLYRLSAQNSENVSFKMSPNIEEEYKQKQAAKTTKAKKSPTGKPKVNLVLEENNGDIQIEDIKDAATLQKAIDAIMNNLKTNESHIREYHQYAQILPAKYYEPGSHLLNRKVAFALKSIDDRLFLSWVQLRSKASDFDYNDIPRLAELWKNAFHKRPDGVTRGSIIYWAKQDAFEEYEKVKKSTIDYYIEETIYEAGDFDFAMVLYHMFKDKYVCSSIRNKQWYVFKRHRWEKDEGVSLRLAISTTLFQMYNSKQSEYFAEAQNHESGEEHHEKIQRKIKKISEICIKLKKTNDKNNIMREAMEIFFDKDFIKNMDSNPWLMCFKNGVYDFKAKEFRQGYPQDYITKTTDVNYVPYVPGGSNTAMNDAAEEINDFMRKLFPQPNLCRYMWDHLASALIGIKKEHAFNIYRGSGSNGKSMLTDLMSHALGDYKGTVPITLVTDKRGSIGGTSSEVIQLKGVRYAVMQEPSKDAVINEGILKELTGGDPLQARALYSDSEIFIPQFTLAVCTNSLFEVKSNDDGTWRRMKLVDFISKFISEGEVHTDDTKYVFPKDKGLKEKLPLWAPTFISMLVKRAIETDGEVKDCSEVTAASCKYRQSQDAITGFINEKIVKDASETNGIGKTLLNSVFKEWFQMEFGNKKPPKLSELEEAMIKKFGAPNTKTRKWTGIRFQTDGDNDDNDDLEDV